ncbi:MAG TPA: PEGA domain-containing protein, partial [Polyangiales bacterium]|nr:PEGA domain-containing protein [Polyangiales bacterium]
ARAIITAFVIVSIGEASAALAQAPSTPTTAPTPIAPTPTAPAPTAPAQVAPAATQPLPATNPEPSAEAKERARSAYAEGQSAFARGDYAQAKAAFEQAFAAVPNPIVLLSVAESATKLGAIGDAINAFDRYLQLHPDAPDRTDITAKRAALAATPAQLSVVTEPAGADVLVDGQPTGKQTPADLQVPPGDHQLKCALTGYESSVEMIQTPPGAKLARRIVLNRTMPPPVAVAPTPALPIETAPAPVQVPAAALWVTGSIGAAGLIAGTVLGFLALKEHSDFNAKPTTGSADRGERLALFSDVGFGVGAMAIITAAVLYSTHDESPAPKKDSARLQLMPQFAPGTAAASARVQF